MSIIIIAVDLLEVVVLTLHEFEKCVNDYIPVNVDFMMLQHVLVSPTSFFWFLFFVSFARIASLRSQTDFKSEKRSLKLYIYKLLVTAIRALV